MDPEEYILNNNDDVKLNVKVNANAGGIMTPLVTMYTDSKKK